MNNEALAELIKSAENRIRELHLKMKKLNEDVCDLGARMDEAHNAYYYELAGNIAHEMANFYTKMSACKSEIAYLTKQIAKHQ